jgi:hypothetical protein
MASTVSRNVALDVTVGAETATAPAAPRTDVPLMELLFPALAVESAAASEFVAATAATDAKIAETYAEKAAGEAREAVAQAAETVFGVPPAEGATALSSRAFAKKKVKARRY